MKRFPLNFRAFCVVAVCVAAVVFAARLTSVSFTAGIAIGCVILAAVFTAAVYFIYNYITKRRRLRQAIGFGVAAVLCLSAFCVGVCTVKDWESASMPSANYAVGGRVCAIDRSDGVYKFILEELTFNGKSIEGKASVKARPSEHSSSGYVRVGDRIGFDAYMNYVGLNGRSYRTNIRYGASVSGGDIALIKGGKPRGIEGFLISVRSLLVKNMGNKYGNLAFSMLTGDKNGLSDEIFNKYSIAGIAHIMAVSGLHISFLAMLICFLLSKLSRRLAYFITLAVLTLYAGVVGFSPSVLRAVIMFAISGAAAFVYGKRDLLSSLACAFSIILAVKPFYIFEVGFIMSFGSIFGIALFAFSIRNALMSRKVPGKISEAVASSVSVSAGICPAQFYFFGRALWFAPLVNMIVIPYISVLFIATFVCLPFAAIPGLGGILVFPKLLFVPLDGLIGFVSSIPAAVSVIRSGAAVFVCYPIMFCASKYFMLDKGKRIQTAYSLFICLLIVVICAL